VSSGKLKCALTFWLLITGHRPLLLTAHKKTLFLIQQWVPFRPVTAYIPGRKLVLWIAQVQRIDRPNLCGKDFGNAQSDLSFRYITEKHTND
jgi:hypothetical protein